MEASSTVYSHRPPGPGPGEPRSNTENPADMQAHYRIIGCALLVCEAGAFSVGVPVLLPTSRVSGLRRDFSAPLADFVREQLVTVSTKNLNSYLDDLERAVEDGEIDENLCIPEPTPLESYGVAVTVFAAAGLACAGGLMAIGKALSVAAIGGAIIGGIAGALAAIGLGLTSPEPRLRSFTRVVRAELMRRQGLDEGGRGGIRIYSVEAGRS